MREEMEAIDWQEVTLPVVHPGELWQQSGRWDAIGSDLARLSDRNGRDLCLAMTHEEAMAELVAQWSAAIVSSLRALSDPDQVPR